MQTAAAVTVGAVPSRLERVPGEAAKRRARKHDRITIDPEGVEVEVFLDVAPARAGLEEALAEWAVGGAELWIDRRRVRCEWTGADSNGRSGDDAYGVAVAARCRVGFDAGRDRVEIAWVDPGVGDDRPVPLSVFVDGFAIEEATSGAIVDERRTPVSISVHGIRLDPGRPWEVVLRRTLPSS